MQLTLDDNNESLGLEDIEKDEVFALVHRVMYGNSIPALTGHING